MPYGLTVKQINTLAEYIADHMEVETDRVKAAIDAYTKAEVVRIAKNERGKDA